MKYIVVVVFFFTTLFTHSQELNCKVSVVHRQIQGSNTAIFQTLENALNEFVNNRKWTNDEFSQKERIDCNLLINLSKMENNEFFSGSITIQARRPVYNSTYNSLLINYIDRNFSFRYIEFDPIIFNENSFDSNLASVIGYYVYLILGLDYDSYSPMGGQPFFQVAEQIVNNAQNASESGWKPMESRNNRYWLIEQLLHDDFKPVRMFYYTFHRLGLDAMAEKPAATGPEIVKMLKTLEPSFEKQPSAILFQILSDTKYEEFVNIFKPQDPGIRSDVGQILKKIDPQHIQEYDKMISG
jgi:hypothetical protein